MIIFLSCKETSLFMLLFIDRNINSTIFWQFNVLTLHKQVIAEFLSVEEAAGIKEAFDMIDTDKKGKINLGELRVGLQKLGHHIPDADLQILMDAVSAHKHILKSLTVSQNVNLA